MNGEHLKQYEDMVRGAMIASFEETKQDLINTGKFDEETCCFYAREATMHMLVKATAPMFGGMSFEEIFGGKTCR